MFSKSRPPHPLTPFPPRGSGANLAADDSLRAAADGPIAALEMQQLAR